MSPALNKSVLQQRAKLLTGIRQFFTARDVMEVETPLLCPHTVTDRYIESFAVKTDQNICYLQTSPEYAMKRLLVAGSGSIYQICKAFRKEEPSVHHNPEFTMLEWYRPGFDADQLISEIDALMQTVVQAKPSVYTSYQNAFLKALNTDPLTCSEKDLQQLVNEKGNVTPSMLESGKDNLLNFCFSQWVETKFDKDTPTFVTDFPASQAALAEINPDDPRTAKRFELYYKGLELANGFQELTDPVEQKKRFVTDQDYRRANNQFVPEIDAAFIAALETGLPACSGVALGVDRLLMCLTQTSIAEVLFS